MADKDRAEVVWFSSGYYSFRNTKKFRDPDSIKERALEMNIKPTPSLSLLPFREWKYQNVRVIH